MILTMDREEYLRLKREKVNEYFRKRKAKWKIVSKQRESDEKQRVRREYEEECRKIGVEP